MFHTFLKKEIERLKLSDRQLARLLQISVPTVGRWKTGKSIPAKYIQEYVLLTLRGKDNEC